MRIRSWSAAPLWIAQHGVVFAVRVLLAMTRLSSNNAAGEWTPESGLVLLETDAYANEELHENVTAWRIVRGALAIASDEDYGAARALADAVRHDLCPSYKAAVSFLFSDEPWSAASELTAADYQGVQLAMASADATSAMTLAALPTTYPREIVLTLLARCGADAAPVLARLLAIVPKKDRKELAAGLALVRTPEALALWLPFVDEKALAAPMLKAFKAMPDVGRALLASKTSAGAKALLAKLGS